MSESSLLPMHRRAINAYIMGATKKDAAVGAGFAAASAYDFFRRPDVQREIERRMKVSEDKVDMDREYLLKYLRLMIEAEPGELLEVDVKGRPSLNWKNLSPGLKQVMGKLEVVHERPGGKYKRQKMSVKFDTPDRLAAIKEAATLLGLREEKHTVAIEESIINRLSKTRDRLAAEEDDEG